VGGGVPDHEIGRLQVIGLFDPPPQFVERSTTTVSSEFGPHPGDDLGGQRAGFARRVSECEQSLKPTALVLVQPLPDGIAPNPEQFAACARLVATSVRSK